jgi:hypothetical protein
MEAVHAAAEAALVEARRRVRLNERQGEQTRPRSRPCVARYFSSQEEEACVMPLRWNAVLRSSGMSERSPRTIPRTTAASRGLRP